MSAAATLFTSIDTQCELGTPPTSLKSSCPSDSAFHGSDCLNQLLIQPASHVLAPSLRFPASTRS